MHFGPIMFSTLRETADAIRRRWLLLLIFAVLHQVTILPVDFRIRAAFSEMQGGTPASASTFFPIPPPYDFLLAGLVGLFWMGFLLHAAREAAEGFATPLAFDRAMAANQFKIYVAVVIIGGIGSSVLAGSFIGGITAGHTGAGFLFHFVFLGGPAALFLGTIYVAGRSICFPALLASGSGLNDALSESWNRTATDRTSVFACLSLTGLVFVLLSAVSKTLPPFPGAMLWTHGSSLLVLFALVMSGVCSRILSPPVPPRRVMEILGRGPLPPAAGEGLADRPEASVGLGPSASSRRQEGDDRTRSALGSLVRRVASARAEGTGSRAPEVPLPERDQRPFDGTVGIRNILGTSLREAITVASGRWHFVLLFVIVHQLGSVHAAWRIWRREPDFSNDVVFLFFDLYVRPFMLTTPYDVIVPAVTGLFWVAFLLHLAREAAEGVRSMPILDPTVPPRILGLYVAAAIIDGAASFAVDGAASQIASQGKGGFHSTNDVVLLLLPFLLLVGIAYLAGRSICAPALIGTGRSIRTAFSESWALTAGHGTVLWACALVLPVGYFSLPAASYVLDWPEGPMLEVHGRLFIGLFVAAMSGVCLRILSSPDLSRAAGDV